MNIRDIMRAPHTITPDTSVTDVARRILASGEPALTVVEADGTIVGLVTQRDLVSKHARVHVPAYLGILGAFVPFDTHRTQTELRHVLSVTARDLMSDDVRTIAPEGEIDDAASLMVEHDADPVLVVENERLIGVVTRLDIVRLLVLEDTDDDAPAPS